ncbi:MAG: hypothetical protein HW374_792, partial [Bacteroidetes bacterium]|nr:hypothetical protein [Bacteroidota bacterium]
MKSNLARLSTALISMLFSVLLTNCKNTAVDPGPVDEPDITDGRITVTNGTSALDARVQYFDNNVPVDTTGLRKGQLQGRVAAFSLRLRAQVSPPSSGGTTLQATHVALDGNYAYVSYNVQGNTYLGGVDVFDISDKRRPRLISQAIFRTTDVSALYYSNISGPDKLYLAEATSDTGFYYAGIPVTAVLEEITLSNRRLTLTSRRVGVKSFAATDVKVTGGKVFVTSGSVGGLTILSQTTLQEVSPNGFNGFDDARAVDIYGASSIVAMQGTPARLRKYDVVTNAFQTSYTVGGAMIAESKSTITVLFNRCLVAAGDGGTKVVDLQTGTVTDALPRAIVTGIDSSLTVTIARGRASVTVPVCRSTTFVPPSPAAT